METAIPRWRDLLGDAHVIVEPDALAHLGAATYATTSRIMAWLRPGSAAEVAACLAIASATKTRVHPVSRGRNWGYGSRVPPTDAAVIDLARLDRIVDFDERLAYVTVEPGVTFRQLAGFLRGCRARVWASVTGGPAEGSVLANALERGDGSGPLGDRFGHVCGLELALPDGRLVHTGFARFPGSRVAPLARWGVGPSLDGLFSQGGPGIVTRATIWLAPYPAQLVLGAFRIADDAQLPAVIDAVRGLGLAGVTTSTVPVWNDLKALSLAGPYPWEAAGGTTPLPEALRGRLRAEQGLGRWNGTVSLYGASRLHAQALRGVVEDTLGPLAELAFRDGPADPLAASETDCGPVLGVPHDHGAAAVYWRKRMPRPAVLDPDRDRCGFLWLGHAVPCEGGHARTIADLYEAELTGAGFEAAIALLAVTPRALSAVAQLAYDRDVPGEDERARACHDRVFEAAVARGYPPFRRGVGMPPLAGEPAYADALAAIRRALDPAGVLG